jgi:hypothetical protein
MLVALSSSIYAEDMDVPVAQQYSIFMKILECDREFTTHNDSSLVFAIVYQSGNKQSLNTHDDLMNIISKSPIKTINNIPLKFISIDLSRDLNLDAALTSGKVDAIYIAPLRAYKIENIAASCHAQSILSFTGVLSYVDLGLAVSIANRGGKPQIVINLPAAKTEGANFNSQMLRLAKVID